MKKILAFGASALALVVPAFAFAQSAFSNSYNAGPSSTLDSILIKISQIINFLIPLLITVAIVVFIWGVLTYVIAKDEEAKTAGRDKMIMGIIGLFAIVAVWGLVRVLTNTFLGGNQGVAPSLPCIPGSVKIDGTIC